MTSQEVLDLPMDENDSGTDTVRGYLKKLLQMLWQEGEGFSGKRPFGNSDWEYELYRPLVKAGLVAGDEDGYPNDDDERSKANTLIFAAVDALS